MSVYRIAEHNDTYECGWIFITNGIFGKKAIIRKLIELRKHNKNVLEIVRMDNNNRNKPFRVKGRLSA